MYKKPTTLTEFILEEERKYKDATGSFTLLLTHIENATKIIASHIKRTGLVDIIGETGSVNASMEDVKKIDEFSNQLLVDTLSSSGQVGYLASEEMDKEVKVDSKGKYNVFFDPLDGSLNVDVAMACGTIFSIYHNSGTLLQKGREQVAAGYVLYGTSVMFVYTSGNGVNGFTLDPSIGSFLLSHPNIRIPHKGKIYSTNEAYAPYWSEELISYMDSLKKEGYKARLAGALVADAHRTLLKGGVYLYPRDKKNVEGKLRLMYEVNPFAFILGQAGGKAESEKGSPLDILPIDLHQRVPIVLGSPKNVDDYMSFF